MRLLVGDEGGLVKEVSVERNAVVQTWGAYVDKSHQVNTLAWGAADESSVLIGRKDGSADLVGVAEGSLLGTVADLGAPVVGAAPLPDGRLVLATDKGAVDARQDLATPSGSSWSAGMPLGVLRAHATLTPSVLASGGKENDLRVWDVNGTALFSAKNVRNTMLDLRVPVHITDLRFLNEAGTRIATTTMYHQVRVYDTKAQRRPVLDFEVGKFPINTCDASADGLQLVVGDTIGNVRVVDLRAPGRVLAAFSGIAGGITSVSLHPSRPLAASVGLDRFVRVHNTQTKQLVAKVYLKQRLTAVLFSGEGDVAPQQAARSKAAEAEADNGAAEEEDESAEDEEALWESLPEVKRASSSASTTKRSKAAAAAKSDQKKSKKRKTDS